MVRIHGTSGAFKSLQSRVAAIDASAVLGDVADLRTLVDESRRVLQQRQDIVRREVDQEIQDRTGALRRWEQEIAAIFERESAVARKLVDNLELEISAARQRGRQRWLAFLWWWGLKGIWLRVRIAWIRKRPERHRKKLSATADAERAHLDSLQRAPEREVERRLRPESTRVRRLKELSESPEAAGAAGELDVIEVLRALTDEFVTLNDLHLKPNRFLRDADKTPLMSAQLDHVVVGPTGVFLIETKNWSPAFASTNDAHDPIRQAGRAGRLLWSLLKDQRLPCRVQNVVVTHAQLRDGKGEHVYVVRPSELVRWIRGGRNPLEAAQVEAISGFLHRYVAASAPHRSVTSSPPRPPLG
jgi:hypothetical protein